MMAQTGASVVAVPVPVPVPVTVIAIIIAAGLLSGCSTSTHTVPETSSTTVSTPVSPVQNGSVPFTLNSASCTANAECVIVGWGNPLFSTTGGRTWSASSGPYLGKESYLYAVSCPVPSQCAVVGQVSRDVPAALYSANFGREWSRSSVPPSLDRLRGISCPSVHTCVAAGQTSSHFGGVMYSSDVGRTWEMDAIVPFVNYLYGVSCSSVTHCVAVGYKYSASVKGRIVGAAVYSSDGGRVWAASTLPLGISVLSGVTCRPTGRCVAVGVKGKDSGIVLYSVDGGIKWSTGVFPSMSSYLSAVSCFSETSCSAIGYRIPSGKGISFDVVPTLSFYDNTIGPYWGESTATAIYSTDGGRSWRAGKLPSLVNSLYGISCILPHDCVAAGWDVNDQHAAAVYSTDGGRSWKAGVLGHVTLGG